MQRYFDNGNKVTQDACAIEAKIRDNQSMIDYNTYNFFNASSDCANMMPKITDFAMNNPNLSFRVGYGFAAPCVIDNDTKLRMGANVTHGPERQNLCTRNFVAGPNLSKGELLPNVEAELINGVRTFSPNDCHKIAETQFNTFAPLDPCVERYITGAGRVIDDDIRMGRPSKEMFLKARASCGSS